MTTEKTDMKGMRSIAPFGLRMQEPLRRAIESAAKASGRSVNSEIVHRLTESLASVNGRHPAKPGRNLAAEPRSDYGLSAADALVVEAFRDLEPETQLGLIAFLRGIVSRKRGARPSVGVETGQMMGKKRARQ